MFIDTFTRKCINKNETRKILISIAVKEIFKWEEKFAIYTIHFCED